MARQASTEELPRPIISLFKSHQDGETQRQNSPNVRIYMCNIFLLFFIIQTETGGSSKCLNALLCTLHFPEFTLFFQNTNSWLFNKKVLIFFCLSYIVLKSLKPCLQYNIFLQSAKAETKNKLHILIKWHPWSTKWGIYKRKVTFLIR